MSGFRTTIGILSGLYAVWSGFIIYSNMWVKAHDRPGILESMMIDDAIFRYAVKLISSVVAAGVFIYFANH